MLEIEDTLWVSVIFFSVTFLDLHVKFILLKYSNIIKIISIIVHMAILI